MEAIKKIFKNGELNESAFRGYFKELEDRLLEKIQDLANRKYTLEHLEKGRGVSGVYIFWDNDNAIYAGRTNNIYNRYKQHLRMSNRQSPLAKKLARETLANDNKNSDYLLPSYGKKDRAKKINKEIKEELAKGNILERLENMKFSFVREENAFLQELLEKICFLTFDTADRKQITKKGNKGQDNINKDHYCYYYYNSFDTS